MNEVSIIINGVRYDAVDTDTSVECGRNCDLASQCLLGACVELLKPTQVFKKSDKKGKDVKPKDNGQEDKQEDR